MLKAIKVRLYPTPEQEKALAFQFGAMRWAYNHALEWRQTAWKERGETRHQADDPGPSGRAEGDGRNASG